MAASPSALGIRSLVSSDVFVAEHYLGGTDPLRAETLTRVLRARATGLRHALFLPTDDTFFAVYDGASADAVRAATVGVSRSSGSLDRIVRAVLLDPQRSAFPTDQPKER
jgi:hypothetical protein